MTGSTDRRIGGGGAAASAGIVFEQQLGALLAAWLLAEQPMHAALGLGSAAPVWLRFETEAPVDDILVGTSRNGFVAIQAKTSVGLSRDLGSAFGKTVSQFVRHWLACRDGDGAMLWNRPLDPDRDRLVLAVGPETPSSVVTTLPEALRLKSQPGGGMLNEAQTRAFEQFEACVRQAWAEATAEPYDPRTAAALAGLIRIFAFDPAGLEDERLRAAIALEAPPREHGSGLFAGLQSVSGELMAQRGGVDLATLRRTLVSRGIRLAPPADYRRDIAVLQAHSARVAETLSRYENVEAKAGEPVSIERECEDAIRTAALEGSLLVVGEPGAGKSGVLNALARYLRASKHDVLELAVDRHSVETLQGLRDELGLEHGLIETLDAWDGSTPGWLVIDALDATRGGQGEAVFRSLIERVMERGGRWRVIASIRTFDLKMGQQFRALFKGAPPVASMQAPGLQRVRHVQVPPWSPSEFEQLLARMPSLAAALANAPETLRELATVPFNTRLICELIKDGLVTADFSRVASQTELLQLYWEHRVEALAGPAQICIRSVIGAMVETRSLRAAYAATTDRIGEARTLDELERRGVLVSLDNRRWVQFRHHILFDYAAARVLLDPDALVEGRQKFSKADAAGLMLAPALAFLLREIWDGDPTRSRFWAAAAHLLADIEVDPVIRSATARICAEYPASSADLRHLALRIVDGDEAAATAFVHASGAFAVRLEDHPETPLAPWSRALREVARNVAPVAGTVRFLLFRLLGAIQHPETRADLGFAARALLAHALSLADPRSLNVAAIDLVGETYATDPQASRALLQLLFLPERLHAHASDEVPALCRKIELVADCDPAFAGLIYRGAFGFTVTEAREAKLGDSRILPLRTDTKQNYEMARYALAEFMPKFLDSHPDQAVEAIMNATESYVAREHPIEPGRLDVSLHVGPRVVRLREDWSHIWAHDPGRVYGYDADALIKHLLEYLRHAEDAAASNVAERLIATGSLAVLWSRLFLASGERGGVLLDAVLPIAMERSFLTLPDTRKDAIDVVAAGYGRLSEGSRELFETAVRNFDFSEYESPADAKASFESRLFGAIGDARLVTDHAKAVVAERSEARVPNQRLFRLEPGWGSPERYHWIDGLDQDLPANRRLISMIDAVKDELKLDADASSTPLEAGIALDRLEALAGSIDRQAQHPMLVIDGEGYIAKGLARLVTGKKVPIAGDAASTDRFLRLLELAAGSAGPEVHDDTEAAFARAPSWSSPAPRVDAAEIALDLALQRPDLYPTLQQAIGRLLADRHPAVRMAAGIRLVRIWDLDREGFWSRLSGLLGGEPNQGVLDHVQAGTLGPVLHGDPERTMKLVLALLERFPDEAGRRARMRKSLASHLAVLWITYSMDAALDVLTGWVGSPADHDAEIHDVLITLRDAFVAGLAGSTDDQGGLRRRAQGLAHRIVEAANEGLAAYLAVASPSAEQRERSGQLAQVVDNVCSEFYFASGAHADQNRTEPPLGVDGLRVFFEEIAPTLHAIGEYATPHTVYYLLQLLEFLLPVDPGRAFDLTARALRDGGRLGGYQFEALGADLLVRMVGVFLADHKPLFSDENRRAALIDCLEMFMEAGWPAARRLLYRLPELIQ